MIISPQALKDLNIFYPQQKNIFTLIQQCTTQAATNSVKELLLHPIADSERLHTQQQCVKYWYEKLAHWPQHVQNGTFVVLDAFFEEDGTQFHYPFWVYLIALFKKPKQQAFVEFNIEQFEALLLACQQLADSIATTAPLPIQQCKSQIEPLLNSALSQKILSSPPTTFAQKTNLLHQLKLHYKSSYRLLQQAFIQLDTWYGLAKATSSLGWTFPEIKSNSSTPLLQAKGIWHPLIQKPIKADVNLGKENIFTLLTGPNMSGKSTYIRTLGILVLLSQIGMGVPAESMTFTPFKGILTNMQIQDNILNQESYFMSEINAIKHTIQQIKTQAPQLVLMDELFKGTNVHDATICTQTIVEGLAVEEKHIYVLSTHLYELAQQLQSNPKINFLACGIEKRSSGEYHFPYTIQPGIATDSIGYWLLQKSGIINLLSA